jgi:predicted PurR-regulated permease PerM
MTDEARRGDLPPLSYWAKVTVVVLAVIAAALLLNQLRLVALAVFLGLFLAIASEPFIAWLERRGLRRGLAIAVLTVGGLPVLAGVIAVLLYPAVQQVGQLVESSPELLRKLSDQLARFGVRFDDPAIQQRLQDLAGRLPEVLGQSLGALYGILGDVLSTLFTVLTVFVLALYFMFALPRMRSFAARALREPERVEVMNQSLDRIGGLLGVPYAAVLGVGMALFTAIPQVGAIIGSIVCTAVALTQGIDLAIYTLLFILAYQQFENYVLVPRVFSRAVDLSPVAVFIAVLIGGSAVGAVGRSPRYPSRPRSRSSSATCSGTSSTASTCGPIPPTPNQPTSRPTSRWAEP